MKTKAAILAAVLVLASAAPALAQVYVSPAPTGCDVKGYDPAVCLVNTLLAQEPPPVSTIAPGPNGTYVATTAQGKSYIVASDNQVLTRAEAADLVLAAEQPGITQTNVRVTCFPYRVISNASTILSLECAQSPANQTQFANALAQIWVLDHLGTMPWYVSTTDASLEQVVYRAVDSYYQSRVDNPNGRLTVADAARILQGR